MRRPTVSFPLLVLILGFVGLLAANLLWCWPGGVVRVIGGALASLALPATVHLWPRIPADTWWLRVRRLVIAVAVTGMAAVTTFVHASRLLIAHGEEPWLAYAYPVMTELMVLVAVITLRAPERPPGRESPFDPGAAALHPVHESPAPGHDRVRVEQDCVRTPDQGRAMTPECDRGAQSEHDLVPSNHDHVSSGDHDQVTLEQDREHTDARYLAELSSDAERIRWAINQLGTDDLRTVCDHLAKRGRQVSLANVRSVVRRERALTAAVNTAGHSCGEERNSLILSPFPGQASDRVAHHVTRQPTTACVACATVTHQQLIL